ncbi:MAG: G8 domain-containing protein, partial [Chitinophagales bacterium]
MLKRILPYLILLFLLSTNKVGIVAQMVMDDDCTGILETPMQKEHCKVMGLVPVCCATHVAVADGDWFSASTWSTGTIPLEGDNVYIPDSITVTYNGSSNEAINWLRINGTLSFATTMHTKLVVGTIIVDSEGSMKMGTFLNPIPSNYNASVIFADLGPINTIWDPWLFSRGIVCLGHFESYGAYKKAYTSVSDGLTAGSNKLTLADAPTGWKVGDQIVLTGTYTSITSAMDVNNMWHDEELTITSISGNDVYFTNNYDGGSQLLFDHQPPAGYGLKVYVANLTRNITFQTQNYLMLPNAQRAHAMFMHTLNHQVNNTAFIGMGRTDKNLLVTDPVVNEFGELVSGGGNPRGRYACHFHFGGAMDATLTPVTLSNCVVNGTPGWGFVNHQSYVQMDQNVVYNFRGSAFVSEDGNEIGSMTGNIAIKGLYDNSAIERITRIMTFDMGFDGSGYWLQSPNIDYINNIAASCSGAGFAVFSDDDDLPANKRFLLPKSTLLNPVIAGTEDAIYQAVIPLRSNYGSVVYNSAIGFSLWTHMKNGDDIGSFSTTLYNPYTHNSRSVIENFKFWNINATGFDLNYSSQVTFKNGLLLGDLANRFEGVVSANPSMGYAFHSNTSGSSYEYENLQVEGWKYGPVIF